MTTTKTTERLCACGCGGAVTSKKATAIFIHNHHGRRPFPQNFWSKVEKADTWDTCWIWTAGKDRAGYGVYNGAGLGTRAAHRIAYMLLVGAIPAGLELDHLCRVRACVNPAHLEPVTPRVNQLRGEGFAGQRARQTHCIHGHRFTPENTYITPGRGTRQCRACRRRISLSRRGAA